MFSCESLQSLHLVGKIDISHEIVFCLPRLESLRLRLVSFQSEEILCKLLRGCPVLKYLYLAMNIGKTMENCQLDMDNGIEFRCIISSVSLRRLEVRAYCSEKPVRTPVCSVQLDAPLLEYIKLNDISSIFIRQRLIFLVEANVQLVYLKPAFEVQNYFNSMVKAFHSFDCVKNLTLSPPLIKALSRGTIEMKTKFNNLTRLEVTRVWNWSALLGFLMLADCLEVVTINTGGYGGNPNNIDEGTDRVPRCLSNSLRTFSVDRYISYEDDFPLVSYVLKHGGVLEVMHIHFWDMESEAHDEVVKEISKLPRKSPVCKVEFHEHWICSSYHCLFLHYCVCRNNDFPFVGLICPF